MKWDLVRPCKNCPFSTHDTRIKFATRSRAREIEEHAYREGFPCHEHAEWVEEEDDPIGGGGAYFRQDGTTPHCFGAIYMYLRNGAGNVPWEWAVEEDEDLEERWWAHLTSEQITAASRDVWETEQDFINSHEGDEDDEES